MLLWAWFVQYWPGKEYGTRNQEYQEGWLGEGQKNWKTNFTNRCPVVCFLWTLLRVFFSFNSGLEWTRMCVIGRGVLSFLFFNWPRRFTLKYWRLTLIVVHGARVSSFFPFFFSGLFLLFRCLTTWIWLWLAPLRLLDFRIQRILLHAGILKRQDYPAVFTRLAWRGLVTHPLYIPVG